MRNAFIPSSSSRRRAADAPSGGHVSTRTATRSWPSWASYLIGTLGDWASYLMGALGDTPSY